MEKTVTFESGAALVRPDIENARIRLSLSHCLSVMTPHQAQQLVDAIQSAINVCKEWSPSR